MILKEVYCLKDLKHLIYFENLLQDAQNELVDKAVAEGKHALGYNCYYIPEVLLNLPGCFSSRLRAPRCNSTDVANYYMTNRVCPYVRSILERGIEGGYNYLEALFGAESCAAMERMEEHFFLVDGIVKNDKFFVTQIDPPIQGDKIGLDYYKAQLMLKVVEPLRDKLGVDVSEQAMREAVEQHNELCRIITEIGDLRKLDNPPITGYEFHVIQLVSQVCPHYLILPYLRETLEELRTREPEEKFPFRARVALVGSEIDDPKLIKLIEGCGALVVADRFCYGSFPGRQEIPLQDGEDALTQVCRWYLQNTDCPRQCAAHRVQRRYDRVAELVSEYKADGVIYEQMKFCTYWSYERTMASHIMPDEYGINVLSIDRPYISGQSGQLRTRVQAFVESLEIKKLNAGNKEKQGR